MRGRSRDLTRDIEINPLSLEEKDASSVFGSEDVGIVIEYRYRSVCFSGF